MSIKTQPGPMSDPHLEADEEAVMAHYVSGKPLDPEVVRPVQERARKITEETYRKHGLVDEAVPAIRELRGELPTWSTSWTLPWQ
jgi:hypothetical protein